MIMNMRPSRWLTNRCLIGLASLMAALGCQSVASSAPLGYFPPYSHSRHSSPLWFGSKQHRAKNTPEIQLIKTTLKELSKAGISRANRKTCITRLGNAVSKVSSKALDAITSTTSSSEQLERMAECCAEAGLDDLAEEMAHCSLVLAQQERQNKEVVETLDSLAGLAYKKGDCNNAAQLLNQALDIQRTYSFQGSSDTGLLLNHLAFCYARAGKFEDSERALKQAIKSDQERMGEKSFAVAEDTYNLGVTQAMRGDFQQAVTNVKRALEMLSELPQDTTKEKAEWSKFYSEIQQRLIPIK